MVIILSKKGISKRNLSYCEDMLSINPKYWIIILKLSSWFLLQKANKYVLGALGKWKHQVPFHGVKLRAETKEISRKTA